MLCINLILVARGYIYKMSQSVIIMPTSEFKEQSVGEMYGKYFICGRKKCMKVVKNGTRDVQRILACRTHAPTFPPHSP